MDLTGSSPITPVLRPGSNELILRANQRIAAEVLRVAGEQIVLSLQGVPIVAKLVSPEQSATLGEHQLRQFIVRDVSGQVVTLQLVNSPAAPAQAKPQNSQDIVSSLLQQIGIADTPENSLLARAVLSERLLLTPELLGELRDALAALPGWGSREAQMAAALKAAGYPVSDGILSMALNARTEIGASVTQLLEQLKSFRPLQGEPPQAAAAAQAALEILSEAILDAKLPVPRLQDQLQQAILLLGRSIEHDLSAIVEGKTADPKLLQKSLAAFAELRGQLDETGHGALVKTIDRFLEGVRWSQFLNISPEQDPRGGQWTRLDFPIQLPGSPLQNPSGEPQTARLRIAYDGDSENPRIDARATHLVIQVDLSKTESIEVDLSVAGQRVGVEVTASNQELCDLAQAELGGLSVGLGNLGYQLERSLCSVGIPASPADPRPATINESLCRPVDVSI